MIFYSFYEIKLTVPSSLTTKEFAVITNPFTVNTPHLCNMIDLSNTKGEIN